MTYCIGWLPHLNGVPFLTNRWKEVIKRERQEGEKLYFRADPKNASSFDHTFNTERIVDFYGSTQTAQIRTRINSASYLAQCRPSDDTDPKIRWFFVYIFNNKDLRHLDEVYIFYPFVFPERSSYVTLRFLARIKVADIDDEGFMTAELIETAIGTQFSKPSKPAENYLEQTFYAVRDIVHTHSHHTNPNSHPHHKVPDSLIRPIFSPTLLDPIVGNKIAASYQRSLLKHLEHISLLVNTVETKKRTPRKGYSELVTVIKQGNGIFIYYRQLLLELRRKNHISLSQLDDLKESSQNMKDAYRSFYENLDSHFQMTITKRTEYVLIMTLVLTGWIVLLELDNHHDVLTQFPYLLPVAIIASLVAIGYCIYYHIS